MSNLCFDINSFVRFAEGLHGIQQGTSQVAILSSLGEMLELRLERISRKLQADLKIREYLAPDMATLTANFEVDYDLFVNKLLCEVEKIYR